MTLSSLQAFIRQWLNVVNRFAWAVIVIIMLLTGISFWYAGNTLGINTDVAQMLDKDLPFRQVYDDFRQRFPNLAKTLLVVVEAPTAEEAKSAAREVYNALRSQPEYFLNIDWPAGDQYFLDRALLFIPIENLEQLSDQLIAAQPLLAGLATDTSINGLLDILIEANNHASQTGTNPQLESIRTQLAHSIDALLANPDSVLPGIDWQSLLGGSLSPNNTTITANATYREMIVIEPVLNFDKIMPAKDTMITALAIRERLGLQPDNDVHMLLTGSVALEHEELTSSLAGARFAGLMALFFVTIIMAVGLRSFSLVSIVLLSLIAGFGLTVAMAALTVGRINLISIAFTVLYVGLGVNYGIHIMLGYREQLQQEYQKRNAILATGTRLSGALSLSALTTAIGFFAFVPTAFVGVAELGLIAGFSMLITLFISYTLTPALLSVLPAPRPYKKTDYQKSVRLSGDLLNIPLEHRRIIILATALFSLTAALIVPRLSFDSDPLNLRDRNSESVQTIRLLLDDKATGHRNLQVLVSNNQQARTIAMELQTLDDVERVIRLQNLIPTDQEDKLLLLEDLRFFLGDALVEKQWLLQPSDTAQLKAQARQLAQVTNESPLKTTMSNLAAALDILDSDTADTYSERLNLSTMKSLPPLLAVLTNGLQQRSITRLDDIPARIRNSWVSPDGTQLLQVFPSGNANDFEFLEQFVEAVSTVAPRVTGTPVIQIESGKVISKAFAQAVLLALIGITIVLLILLRDMWLTMKILLPLLLGSLFSAAALVTAGISLNYANVVAIPLLLGVGVDNGIHLVYRQRAGNLPGGNVLRTAAARAIVIGALTTLLSFGNLAFSPHTGTASMGFLLAFGLFFIVITTLIVLPAILPSPDNNI